MVKSIHPSLNSIYKLIENNQATTTPYLIPSRLYWKKALAKLEHQSGDTCADASLVTMDLVYLACTVYHSFAPYIKHVSPGTSWINIVWNYIDVAGAAVVGINEGLNQDAWARFWYLVCAVQLTIGTAYTVWVVAESLNNELTQDHLITSAASSGYTFAAAMAFSSSLEYRDYKLGLARIEELKTIETNLKQNTAAKHQIILHNIEQQLEKDPLLKDDEIKNTGSVSALEKEKLIQLARVSAFLKHEQKDNSIHSRGTISWGLCAIAMTIVANTSTCIEAFDLTDEQTTILAAMTSLFSVILSSVYRNWPYVCKPSTEQQPKLSRVIPISSAAHQTPAHIEMNHTSKNTRTLSPLV